MSYRKKKLFLLVSLLAVIKDYWSAFDLDNKPSFIGLLN